MISTNPDLPQPNSPNFNADLIWKLTNILRLQAQEINKFSGSTWNGPHPIFGVTHLWVDAVNDIRAKSSAPTSDLDGTVVVAL